MWKPVELEPDGTIQLHTEEYDQPVRMHIYFERSEHRAVEYSVLGREMAQCIRSFFPPAGVTSTSHVEDGIGYLICVNCVCSSLPLDLSLLDLREEEAWFFKSLSGITNDEELRRHIIDVADKAYAAYNYPCIRCFSFTQLKIFRLSTYQYVLQLGRERPGAILLDAACCFGNDLRRAVFDGWPAENTLAFDLEPAFWEYGHELFRSTQESFPVGFIGGDAFDPNIIQPHEPFYAPPSTPRPQNLQLLKSLSPLQGHISAIHASSFFHLFDEDKQIELAKRLASLLSPEPGSIIFGLQRGTPVKTATSDLMGYFMVCHNPESWRELWDGQIFEKGTVRVDAVLKEIERTYINPEGGKLYMLDWSVTRLNKFEY